MCTASFLPAGRNFTIDLVCDRDILIDISIAHQNKSYGFTGKGEGALKVTLFHHYILQAVMMKTKKPITSAAEGRIPVADFFNIPYIVLYKGGIETEEQFNAMLEKECGDDPQKQHAFLCHWLREWQQKNPLRFVLAELYDSDEIAQFLCFAADYIEAFDYSAQDMMLDHSYHFGGKRVEAARSKLEAASLKGSSTPAKPSFSDVQAIEEDELPDFEAVFTEELEPLSPEQRLELMTTVFGCHDYDRDDMPEPEDCIASLEVILDENGWGSELFAKMRAAIQDYKKTHIDK